MPNRVNPAATGLPELNAVLVELATTARDVLGGAFVGAYVQGSFALGHGDIHSDCDFLVVTTEPLGPAPTGELRRLHDELPTRDAHWPRHLEGSYADAPTLRTLDGLGTPWLYVDHGSREAVWDTHCNNAVVRWTLRECGITLVGPPPATLVDPVPAEALRAPMRWGLPRLMADLDTWVSWDVAWSQRYAVATICRMLYTLRTARVASKPAALRWAMAELDPRWRPLLAQVLTDRQRGLDFADPPRPGSLEETRAFAAYAGSLATAARG